MDDVITDSKIQDVALVMGVSCVRNTIIEDYHADGKLTEDDMMNFNKEVVNKIYTFLKFFLLHDNVKEGTRFYNFLCTWYPKNWDKPELDEDLFGSFKYVNEHADLFIPPK